MIEYYQKVQYPEGDPIMKKVILSLSALIVIFIVIGIMLSAYSKVFTPEKWAKNTDNRYKMLDSLKEKYNLYDMTREEISNLLGESEQPYAYEAPEHEDYLEYRVGSFTIDPTMLTIEFENEKVVDIYLYMEFRSLKQPLY